MLSRKSIITSIKTVYYTYANQKYTEAMGTRGKFNNLINYNKYSSMTHEYFMLHLYYIILSKGCSSYENLIVKLNTLNLNDVQSSIEHLRYDLNNIPLYLNKDIKMMKDKDINYIFNSYIHKKIKFMSLFLYILFMKKYYNNIEDKIYESYIYSDIYKRIKTIMIFKFKSLTVSEKYAIQHIRLNNDLG